jgi:hypothetical protein
VTDYIDWGKSVLKFQTSDQCWFTGVPGQGSALNFFKRIIVLDKFNTELYRVNDINKLDIIIRNYSKTTEEINHEAVHDGGSSHYCGTTTEFSIPMKRFRGFFDVQQLCPPNLVSGMTIIFEFEKFSSTQYRNDPINLHKEIIFDVQNLHNELDLDEPTSLVDTDKIIPQNNPHSPVYEIMKRTEVKLIQPQIHLFTKTTIERQNFENIKYAFKQYSHRLYKMVNISGGVNDGKWTYNIDFADKISNATKIILAEYLNIGLEEEFEWLTATVNNTNTKVGLNIPRIKLIHDLSPCGLLRETKELEFRMRIGEQIYPTLYSQADFSYIAKHVFNGQHLYEENALNQLQKLSAITTYNNEYENNYLYSMPIRLEYPESTTQNKAKIVTAHPKTYQRGAYHAYCFDLTKCKHLKYSGVSINSYCPIQIEVRKQFQDTAVFDIEQITISGSVNLADNSKSLYGGELLMLPSNQDGESSVYNPQADMYAVMWVEYESIVVCSKFHNKVQK